MDIKKFLGDSLEKLSVAQLKNLVRLHNLEEYIKLKQSKEVLVNLLLKYYSRFDSTGKLLVGIPRDLEYRFDTVAKKRKSKTVKK